MNGEITNNRICKRCLLIELDENEYNEKLKSHIDGLPASMKTEESVYKNRLDKCRECEKLAAGTCLVCGCYVEMRAAIKRGKCPIKKW